MPALFTQDWMSQYGSAWNAEPDLGQALAKINFNSVIGYGIDGEDAPRAYIRVVDGIVTEAGDYGGQELSWDLRASEANWEKWCKKGLGMVGLGMAYTSRKLKFQVGDYTAMVKNPAMAGPFIKSFTVMGTIPRD